MPKPMREPQHLTDDKRCPECGRRTACPRHSWAYRKWYEALKAALEERSTYQLKPLRPS